MWITITLSQRWNPVDGFSDRLLPSDRWQWSDVTGLQHQALDSFHLPSDSWDWEGDWYVDENFEGEPTEKGVSVTYSPILLLLLSYNSLLKPRCCPSQGWSYAIDFPAFYTKDKKWNSCVRRRRWIRYRRYKAMDTWAKVSVTFTASEVCLFFVFAWTLHCLFLTDPLTAHNTSGSIQWHQLRWLGDQWGAQRSTVALGRLPTGQGALTYPCKNHFSMYFSKPLAPINIFSVCLPLYI